MAFEGVQITSTLNASVPVNGFRDDLASGDTVGLALTSDVGIATYRWQIVGRPEQSTAGGTGPEPVSLGTAASATFTVDNDTPIPKDGTYNVACVVNEGTPSETRILAILCRNSTAVLDDGRTLRKLGGFELFDEDTSIPSILQGWATQMNRWLEKLLELSGGSNPGRDWHSYPLTKGDGTTSGYRQSRMWFAGQGDSMPAGYNTANLVITADTWYALPVIVPVIPVKLSNIWVWATGSTLNAGKINVFANASDGDFYPGARLFDSGQILPFSSGGGTTNNAQPDLDFSGDGGSLIWICVNVDVNSGTPQFLASSTNIFAALGGIRTNQVAVISGADPDYGALVGWKIPETFTTGAMASTMPHGVGETPILAFTAAAGSAPMFWYEWDEV